LPTGGYGGPGIDVGSGGPVAGNEADDEKSRRACQLKNTRITHYDQPKGNTAINGDKPVENRTAAADPTYFGFAYPRGGKTQKEKNANKRTRRKSQVEIKQADIQFSIPGIGLLNFEDVGGGVDGNHIDVYVEKGAKEKGAFNRDVIAYIPVDRKCPSGSEDLGIGVGGSY
jgi:3D (Asp-Asp-Asp) domain-containing protein